VKNQAKKMTWKKNCSKSKRKNHWRTKRMKTELKKTKTTKTKTKPLKNKGLSLIFEFEPFLVYMSASVCSEGLNYTYNI
jgi:hypothetical protein